MMAAISRRYPSALILVSAAIAISYLDRQTLPVAVKAIAQDIPLSNEQFACCSLSFCFPMRSCMRGEEN
jgi:hypothetical protein